VATNDGPYVQAAVFCDRVITSQAAQLSFVDIVEGATIVVDDPDEKPFFSLESFQLAITLWTVPVPSLLMLRPWRPNGVPDEPIEIDSFDAHTERPIKRAGGGVNVVRPGPRYLITERGQYWFDVLLRRAGREDRLLTRIPLAVEFAVTQGGTG
jgi:hypothetical protein